MTIESIVENMTDDEAEQLGRWWAIRKAAIDLGLVAERELSRFNALSPKSRRFISLDEWQRLTGAS